MQAARRPAAKKEEEKPEGKGVSEDEATAGLGLLCG